MTLMPLTSHAHWLVQIFDAKRTGLPGQQWSDAHACADREAAPTKSGLRILRLMISMYAKSACCKAYANTKGHDDQ